MFTDSEQIENVCQDTNWVEFCPGRRIVGGGGRGLMQPIVNLTVARKAWSASTART
jgi:hypothetical protein